MSEGMDSFFDTLGETLSERDWKIKQGTEEEQELINGELAATLLGDRDEDEYPTDDSGPHPLRQGFAFWYMRRLNPRTPEAAKSFEKNIKQIGAFNTAEDFWACYNHLVRPGDLPFSCDFHLFREGVKPIWEDEENKHGGRFVITIPRKRASSKFWEDILLAVVGHQFHNVPDDEICGVIISTRYNKDILSVWTKHADNKEYKDYIHQTIKKVLGLPASTNLEFKPHEVGGHEGKQGEGDEDEPDKNNFEDPV